MARTHEKVRYTPKSKPEWLTPVTAARGVENALKILEGRWKLVILFHLFGGNVLRFSDLERAIPAISQKMLIQQFRRMEADGVIERILHPQVPPKVEYRLTPWGQKLCPSPRCPAEWGALRDQMLDDRAPVSWRAECSGNTGGYLEHRLESHYARRRRMRRGRCGKIEIDNAGAVSRMLVETVYRNIRNHLLLRFGLDLVKIADRKTFLQPIRRVMSETSILLNGCEAYFLMSCVTATANVGGEIAEVGVYRGGSAKLIAEVKGDRELHLFDTFGGLPELTQADPSSKFRPGQFRAMEEEARRYLSSFAQVFIYKGFFPATARPIESKRFSFVHLDVDLFEPTRDALAFFYPRLSRGAVLVSHDYNFAAGVHRAFDEFFQDKPENVLQQPGGTQCFIVKQ